jgi:hypothetical protein
MPIQAYTSANAPVHVVRHEVAEQSLVLVALVAVVAEVPLLTRAHVAALAPVAHHRHAALALHLVGVCDGA